MYKWKEADASFEIPGSIISAHALSYMTLICAESNEVVLSNVCFRKLKLLREFMKYVQVALPKYTVSLVLVLPLHLNVTYHHNSRGLPNGEFLFDLSRNVVLDMQNNLGKQCEILFVDSRAKNDFVVDKIMEVLTTSGSSKSENGKSPVDLGYHRATLPVLHGDLSPSTAKCF